VAGDSASRRRVSRHGIARTRCVSGRRALAPVARYGYATLRSGLNFGLSIDAYSGQRFRFRCDDVIARSVPAVRVVAGIQPS